METIRITSILCFDEIYKCVSITAHLFNEIHITHYSGIGESFHGVLETGRRRDLGEFAGELHLPQLLIYTRICYAGLHFRPFPEVGRP